MMEFYLFDVNHGQSAGLRLPNGRWCIFDLGRAESFSPVRWIASQEGALSPTLGLGGLGPHPSPFAFLKATVSHWHGAHLSEHTELFRYCPEFLRTVTLDLDYLQDVAASSADRSGEAALAFGQRYLDYFGPARSTPDYGGVVIEERSLPVVVARMLGGDANSRVNNGSVVSRIEYKGNSILLCGDMESAGWNHALFESPNKLHWQQLVRDVDLLVTPHHGHASAFSVGLMRLANPRVVLVSGASGDEYVDTRYSSEEFVRGITIGDQFYRRMTTRSLGHIKVSIAPRNSPRLSAMQILVESCQPGQRTWSFGSDATAGSRRPFLGSSLYASLLGG